MFKAGHHHRIHLMLGRVIGDLAVMNWIFGKPTRSLQPLQLIPVRLVGRTDVPAPLALPHAMELGATSTLIDWVTLPSTAPVVPSIPPGNLPSSRNS